MEREKRRGKKKMSVPHYFHLQKWNSSLQRIERARVCGWTELKSSMRNCLFEFNAQYKVYLKCSVSEFMGLYNSLHGWKLSQELSFLCVFGKMILWFRITGRSLLRSRAGAFEWRVPDNLPQLMKVYESLVHYTSPFIKKRGSRSQTQQWHQRQSHI